MHVPIEKEVAEFKVPMDHSLVVHVFDRLEQLVDIVRCLWFCDALSPFDHFVHALVMTQFEQDVAVGPILKEVFVFAYVTVLQDPMDLDFGLQL